MENQTLNFEIGFWHPFGPHAGETAEEIIKRKQKEIDDNGWTLWSFSYKKPETLGLWFNEITRVNSRNVLVFCSDGKGAKEPKSDTKKCNYYIPVNESAALSIPDVIQIPHPMGTKVKASAFIVESISYPTEYEAINLDWFYAGQKKWQNQRSSTFGEHLIKPGEGKVIGKFSVILKLKAPYLAEVGITTNS